MSTYRIWQKFSTVRTLFLLSASLLVFILFTTRRKTNPIQRTDPAELDDWARSHSPLRSIDSLGSPPDSSQLHVVIAHYEEEPFWIGRWLSSLREIPSILSLRPHVTVYTKSNRTSLTQLKEASTADLVVALPNVGREGGTYLYHILSNWDHLPAYTLFTQAQLKKAQQLGSGPTAGQLQEWLVTRLRDQFIGSSAGGRAMGFMSLDRKHDIGYCGHFTDMGKRDEFYPLWPQLFAMMSDRPCAAGEPSVVSFNGHFIVSRERILSRPKKTYEYLQSLVDANADHWIHRERPMRFFKKRFGSSTPSNPLFGHTLERLWHVIFGCADINKVEGCKIEDGEAQGAGGCYCTDDEGSSMN